MISLDNNILNEGVSIVAMRMIEYGKKERLFIIIPNKEKKSFNLSESVHVASTGGNKIAQYFRLKKMGKKIIKKENINFITTQDPFFAGLIGRYLKNKTGATLEIQLHGDFYSSDYYKKSGLKNLIQYYVGKWFVLKKADKIRVVGERIRLSLLNLGISENKIITKAIQNDPEVIESYTSNINLDDKYPNYEKTFLVLGRLEPVKNILWLIEIFKEILKKNNFLLLIVGMGSVEKDIEEQIKNNNLDNNIKLQNWTENPYDYLRSADCLLFPSLSEGYGLVAMEANVIGTKVIMNDVGVANYELKPSDKVKILPINDKEAWIQAILNI